MPHRPPPWSAPPAREQLPHRSSACLLPRLLRRPPRRSPRRLGALVSLIALVPILAGCAGSPPARNAVEVALSAWDADADGTLQGVVVLRDGRLLAQRYWNGASATSLTDVRSAGKSITALLAGIALDRGEILDAQASIVRHWPQAAAAPVGQATLDDLLTMRSGLAAHDDDADSTGHEDRMDASADADRFALTLPRLEAAGRTWRYSSLSAYVAGRVVERASGQSLDDYARAHLFGPLGVTDWRWERDAAGRVKGQGNLWLRTPDMARLGEMVRCGGEFHGRRIIAANTLADILRPRVPIAQVDPYADAYGRAWYFKALPVGERAVPAWFASGNGGNKIYVVPQESLVVAVTSRGYGRGASQRRSQAILQAVLRSVPSRAEGARVAAPIPASTAALQRADEDKDAGADAQPTAPSFSRCS